MTSYTAILHSSVLSDQHLRPAIAQQRWLLRTASEKVRLPNHLSWLSQKKDRRNDVAFKKLNADKIGTPLQNPDMPVPKKIVSQYQHKHQQKTWTTHEPDCKLTIKLYVHLRPLGPKTRNLFDFDWGWSMSQHRHTARLFGQTTECKESDNDATRTIL